MDDLLMLGQQTFDGLGRQLTVEVGGRITQFDYKAGQLPPCANRLPDGKRVAFSYLAALNDVVASIEPDGEPANACTYHPVLGAPAIRSGPLGELELIYSFSGKPLREQWTLEGKVHTTHWRHSLNGVLLELTDSSGETHCYRHDAFGRVCQREQGALTTTLTYDDFSRLETLTTTDGKRMLAQTLTYDPQGREHTRTFVVTLDTETRTCKQTLLYSDLDQVLSRKWEDGDRTGEEVFGYDALGRLTHYTADPSVAPQDPFGNTMLSQHFAFNLLDGYTQVVSTFDDGSADTATFHYENPLDPTQVSRVTHDHDNWPGEIVLNYDACGRVCSDSLGRHLAWDAQDRLTRVEYRGQRCDYRYDPAGNLCDRVLDGTLSRSFFSADLLTHEQTGDQVVQRIGSGRALFALNRVTKSLREVTLLGCDAQGSVRLEADSAIRVRRYSAHGAEPEVPANAAYGYTGERREPLTDWYIPGGNRPYDPIVMGFLSPDSESPFGRGGLNAYAYCGGDPINRIDPDGHAWWKWVIAGVGLALGALALVSSFGAAAPAVGAVFAGGIGALTPSGAASIVSATLAAISLGTGIASTVLEATGYDEKAAGILGWVSLGIGLAGSAVELAPKVATAVAKAARNIGRGTRRMHLTRMGPGDSVTYAANSNNHSGFIDSLHGTGMPAYRNHSDISYGTVRNLNNIPSTPEQLATDLAPYLAGKPKDVPLVLISCEAGRTNYAQRLAESLERPVFAYQEVVFIPEPSAMTHPLTPRGVEGTKNWLGNRVMREAIPSDPYIPLDKWGGKDFRQAIPRLFMPSTNMNVHPGWFRHLSS